MHRFLLPLAVVKGIMMMIVITTLANTGFIESLAVAACSAIITGTFLVISNILVTKRTGEKVEDLKTKVEERTEET